MTWAYAFYHFAYSLAWVCIFRSFSLNALDIFKYSMDESGCAFLRFLTMHLCFGLEKYSFFRYGMCLSKEPVG